MLPRKIITFLGSLLLIGCLAIAAAASPVKDETDYFRDAQTYYRDQNFEIFFGLAQWIRMHRFSAMSESGKDRWLALETMALARRCRWREIMQISDSQPHLGPLTKHALVLVNLKDEFQRYKADPRDQRPGLITVFEASQRRWALNSSELQRLSAPDQLRVKVSSRCTN